MIKTLIISFLIIFQSSAELLIPSDLKVTITSVKKCQSSKKYPVEVYNVAVDLDKGKLTVTGTLTTLVDLPSPIKANLEVERHEFGAWIPIPCVNSIGSCTYSDLCIYSVPSNKTCPESFNSNNVPCRCPIPKGNYTIPPSLQFNIYLSNYFSIYSGKYWAHVSILHKNINLTCYEVDFTIESVDELNSVNEEKDEISIDYSDHINRIFVKMV